MNENRIETTNIWLIRHGEPNTDSKGRCYGSLEIGLSPEGQRQIELVSQALRNELFTAIYVSPRKRAIESGKLLAHSHSCSVMLDERLREIDFGDFEGHKYDDIARSHPDIYHQWMEHPTEAQFPNGESFQQMQTRVLDAAHQIYRKHHGETIAIVSHGGVNRILLANALGISNANIFRIAQRYAALNLIRLIGNYPSVELMNAKYQ